MQEVELIKIVPPIYGSPLEQDYKIYVSIHNKEHCFKIKEDIFENYNDTEKVEWLRKQLDDYFKENKS